MEQQVDAKQCSSNEVKLSSQRYCCHKSSSVQPDQLSFTVMLHTKLYQNVDDI